MNDIIEARKAIQSALLEVSPRVYYENAPLTATYPYLVFNLPNSLYDGANTGNLILEVDGWDKTQSSTALETLMYNVNAKLDRKTVNGSVALIFYLDSKLSIPDDDASIIRRKYNYQLKTIQRR